MTPSIFESGCSSFFSDTEGYSSVRRYRCHICLVPEEDGVSAIVLNLPGVASQGDCESEALQNVREAVTGAIEEYLGSGQEIPWSDQYTEIPVGRCKWILVNVG
jgi:predicted RNase H-like HicB family nuclease